jgi:hypothetical protein
VCLCCVVSVCDCQVSVVWVSATCSIEKRNKDVSVLVLCCLCLRLSGICSMGECNLLYGEEEYGCERACAVLSLFAIVRYL